MDGDNINKNSDNRIPVKSDFEDRHLEEPAYAYSVVDPHYIKEDYSITTYSRPRPHIVVLEDDIDLAQAKEDFRRFLRSYRKEKEILMNMEWYTPRFFDKMGLIDSISLEIMKIQRKVLVKHLVRLDLNYEW